MNQESWWGVFKVRGRKGCVEHVSSVVLFALEESPISLSVYACSKLLQSSKEDASSPSCLSASISHPGTGLERR